MTALQRGMDCLLKQKIKDIYLLTKMILDGHN